MAIRTAHAIHIQITLCTLRTKRVACMRHFSASLYARHIFRVSESHIISSQCVLPMASGIQLDLYLYSAIEERQREGQAVGIFGNNVIALIYISDRGGGAGAHGRTADQFPANGVPRRGRIDQKCRRRKSSCRSS